MDHNVTGQSDWSDLFNWSYAGVNHSMIGNGGSDCAAFIPTRQKIFETLFFTAVGIFEICWAWPRVTLPSGEPAPSSGSEASRRLLLVIMCITFGIEIGFKLATRQFIWILNPCHLITMMQIYLLCAPPSRAVTALFRVQMHCLNGATIAVLFPIVNTRLLPFEKETYYLQHILMLVVPFYLMRSGGVYVAEAYSDFSWTMLTMGLLFIYHWLPLQSLALMSLVNLSNMMCPAVSDPFYSRWYRIAASTHQTLLILIHGKLYHYIGSLFISSQSQVAAAAEKGLTTLSHNLMIVKNATSLEVLEAEQSVMFSSNGHIKFQ
jgi:hypothetical protein